MGKFPLGGAVSGPVVTLTGNNAGVQVGADGSGNINVVGSGSISVTGVAGTHTLTISNSGAVATKFQTDDTNQEIPSAGLFVLAGGNNITTSGVNGSNQASWNLTGTTNHAIQLGNASGSLTSLGVATNGQIPIGSAGANPVLSTLTAGANITITNGAGSITIAANASSETVNYVSVNHAASPYTALATDYYISADVTAGVVSILLPNAPATGRVFVVKDKVGMAATNNITVTTVGGAVNIDGATSFTMNTNYEAISVIFNGTSYEVW